MRSTVSTACRGAVTAGCATVLALVTACAPTDEEPGGAGGSDPSDSSGTPSDTDAALAAYTGMWTVVVEASHEGSTTPEGLEDHASGGALALMRQALEGVVDSGGQVTGEPVLDPELTLEDSTHAVVADCVDDSEWSIGAPAATGGAAPRRVDAELVHDGLAWRVSYLRIWEPGSC
ncbi:hypothetical protein KIK06_08860 [Nocardiopsis sp. EMB25]|uniref:hypothetical protein n=1 Tax=Nocardiopsis sp. EMB25 TaxID=2835867 RepID=UPI0022850FD9|nr:hypothetical protein [Nocardiopsis sp. EMB25]MCY9784001.1 hypothetical protein [Nocardiopsis sp. EMB25]